MPEGELPELQQVNEEEAKRTVAHREYVYDERRRITDVNFVQAGKSQSLKSVLPGEYTIELISRKEGAEDDYSSAQLAWRGGIYDHVRDVILLDESDFQEGMKEIGMNLVLLHETGHAVDYGLHRKEYLPKVMKTLSNDLRIAATQYKLTDVADGTRYLNYIRDNKDWLIELRADSSIEDVQRYFGDKLYDTLVQELDDFCSQLEAKTSESDILPFLESLQAKDIPEVVQFTAQTERRAWANTLIAYRRLKANGINTYVGNVQDVANEALANYHKIYYDYLTPDTRFVSSHQLQTELNKAIIEERQKEQNQ